MTRLFSFLCASIFGALIALAGMPHMAFLLFVPFGAVILLLVLLWIEENSKIGVY